MKEKHKEVLWGWFFLFLAGSSVLGMVKLSLFLHRRYHNGFLKEYVLKHGESDLNLVLIINLVFGLVALISMVNLIRVFIEVKTNKWKKDEEELQALSLAALFALLYPVHLVLQFIMISKHIYQYNALFNAEMILLLGIGIFISICSAFIFNIQWIKTSTPTNENETGIKKIENKSLEEFPVYLLLQEKRMLLHTYMDELSEKEINTLNQMENDLNMLYEKYQLLRSPQKERAYQCIVDVISHQEKELEQIIENIHNKRLDSIERKANRILMKK